jgi:trigger factor
LKTFTTKKNIRQQMAQSGQTTYWREVQGIVARVLSNQDEVKKTFWPSCWELLELFKEKANPTTKEVTYDEFIAASYGE